MLVSGMSSATAHEREEKSRREVDRNFENTDEDLDATILNIFDPLNQNMSLSEG